jgi:hypothetical protein
VSVMIRSPAPGTRCGPAEIFNAPPDRPAEDSADDGSGGALTRRGGLGSELLDALVQKPSGLAFSQIFSR